VTELGSLSRRRVILRLLSTSPWRREEASAMPGRCFLFLAFFPLFFLVRFGHGQKTPKNHATCGSEEILVWGQRLKVAQPFSLE